MKKYIINPEYSICYNEENSVVFTANMENVYILQDVETLIVKEFVTSQSVEAAKKQTQEKFESGTFNSDEYDSFVDKLVLAKILVSI